MNELKLAVRDASYFDLQDMKEEFEGVELEVIEEEINKREREMMGGLF